MSANQPANSQTTTGSDIDYRDPIECEYSLTECRHPVCDCPRKESHTTGWRSVSNWPRWVCRIMFSGLIYPLWGPAALNRNKRRNGKSP